MSYSFIPGPEQPDEIVSVGPNQAIAGAAVGILVLDLSYPYMPGNVANASSYPFPVQFRIMKGSTIPQIFNADPILLDMIVDNGRELIKQGARAIIGACGYFGNYQRKASEILDVPVYLSSVLQVPMMMNGLKPDQKVGVICASHGSLSDDMLAQCGVTDTERLVITGAQDLEEFSNIINCTGSFNSRKIELEMVDLATRFVTEHPEIGTILLECSDMPPYAWAVQKAVGRPVFDFMSLINWVQFGLIRKPIQGFV